MNFNSKGIFVVTMDLFIIKSWKKKKQKTKLIQTNKNPTTYIGGALQWFRRASKYLQVSRFLLFSVVRLLPASAPLGSLLKTQDLRPHSQHTEPAFLTRHLGDSLTQYISSSRATQYPTTSQKLALSQKSQGQAATCHSNSAAVERAAWLILYPGPHFNNTVIK